MIRSRNGCISVALSVCFIAITPATAQAVTLSPPSLAFGNQGLGTTSGAKTVTIKNTSTSKTLNITSMAESGEFPTSSTCGSSLAPGATCTISVSFSPSTIGSIDGAITLVDNATPGTQVVSLNGKGVAPVTFLPTSLTFPRTAVSN